MDAIVNLVGLLFSFFKLLAGLAFCRNEDLAEPHTVLAHELVLVLSVVLLDFLFRNHNT
jgi:hypothetical protein